MAEGGKDFETKDYSEAAIFGDEEAPQTSQELDPYSDASYNSSLAADKSLNTQTRKTVKLNQSYVHSQTMGKYDLSEQARCTKRF